MQIPVDEGETYLRTNFSQSDNRDFRDGDKQSTRYYQSFADGAGESGDDSKRMYNAPIQNVYADSIGELDRVYDKSSNRTTLVNNEVRVYKGGSWRDREYWLDPAQRRYFPQDMASDYIGFRCAMSRVGSKSKKGKRARN
jgi:gliding motility-associated lipoprotein GldJ